MICEQLKLCFCPEFIHFLIKHEIQDLKEFLSISYEDEMNASKAFNKNERSKCIL